MEYNVEESVKTNIVASLNIVNACLDCDVEKAIFVSTDKACSPVNTYGACKFVSERIFTESNYNKGSHKTIFSCVRYGNVLESTGSIIPFFISKMKNKEKIPLTDERMTRFIISPKEAVELIFDALKYGVGGEIFIPQLPAFKITDLIEILKEKENVNSEIEVIGLRPGEKIHELMLNFSEVPKTYKFKNRFVVISSINKYGKKDIKNIEYIKYGTILTEKDMTEYSSEHSVVSKKEIKNIFEKLGLL